MKVALFPENKTTHVQRAKIGRPRRKAIGTCSKCGVKHGRANQRYCVDCHNAYMREWRKSHPLTEEQKVKDRARSYANVYRRRGKLVKVPCETCGSPRSQMHHHDYSKPLDVEWLCRPCHMALHQQKKRAAQQEAIREIIERVA